jgi:hypothetical protein
MPALSPTRREFLAATAAAGALSLLPGTLRAAAGEAIRPFTISFPDEDIIDLRRRIQATKWPDKEQVPDTTQGVQLATMQQLVQQWANHDWRKVEARLNACLISSPRSMASTSTSSMCAPSTKTHSR